MTYEELKNSDLVMFESIRGSHLFGLNTETSDLDTFGLFCCPHDWLMGTGEDFKPIIADEKQDHYYDEISKFIKELKKSNPEALTALFTPKDKILKWDPCLQPLWDIREKLLTKAAYSSFRGYAKSQISKMFGLSKAMNIDPQEVKERKNPLWFITVPRPDSDGGWTMEKWLRENGLKQEHCGITRLPNGIEFYTLYYDWFADKDLRVEDYARLRYHSAVTPEIEKELEEGKKTTMIKFRGIIDPTAQDTTQLRLSSISKEDSHYPLVSFQYNMNAFSSHCRKYKEYWDWVAKRNPVRYADNLGHSYDCYIDEETEFLTNHGWKKYDDVTENDLVGCFNKDLKLVYRPFLSRTDDIYSGKIYTFENSAVRFSVTPNHKLFIKQREIGKTPKGYDWGLMKVEDFDDHGPSRVDQVKFLHNPLPDNPKYSDDFIKLLGYYISEGAVTYYRLPGSTQADKTRPNTISISNMEGGNLVDEMRNLSNNLGCINEYSHKRPERKKTEYTWIVTDKDLVQEILKSGIGSLNKHLPDYVWTFSERQVGVLIDALIQGDGYTHKKAGHQVYYTFSYQLAKDLHTIINLNGRFSQLYGTKTEFKNDHPSNFKLKSGEIHNTYQVFISKSRNQEITIEKSSIKHNNSWTISEVENKRIVCFETEFGTLVTRNHDKLAFHGNSKNSSHAIRIMTMGIEMAEGKGLILDRTGIDREYLIDVKKHKYSFDEVKEKILETEAKMKEAFEKSSLPEEPDQRLLEDILIQIRKSKYGY